MLSVPQQLMVDAAMSYPPPPHKHARKPALATSKPALATPAEHGAGEEEGLIDLCEDGWGWVRGG